MSSNYLTAHFLLLGRERRRGGELEALLGGGDERVEGETSRERQEQVSKQWKLETLVRGGTRSGNGF